MPLKVVHCADIHLDTVFSFLSQEAAQIRREDLRGTFGRITELVREKNADMLIISGDLFDSGDVSRYTLNYVLKKLSDISNTDVYICCGNHDPKLCDSYLNIMDFGENVHVFSDTIEWIEKEEYDIYGVSFGDSIVRDSFLTGFKVKNPDKINIMVMHGDFTSSDYNLITKTQMAESGIDYLALGHIHKHEIIKSEGCTAVYPGCPEGRGFDETGEKGAVYAELTKGKTEAHFIPLSKRKLHEIEIDVTGLYDYDEISSKLSEYIAEKNDLYKIILCGEAEFDIDKDVLKDGMDVFFVKLYDKTSPKIDWEKESEEFTLKGLFIKKALAEIEKDEDDEISKMALKIGMNAIGGR